MRLFRSKEKRDEWVDKMLDKHPSYVFTCGDFLPVKLWCASIISRNNPFSEDEEYSEAMKENKVPIQSLIDHIKTATDVDPWAKEMAEELLKEQEPAEPITEGNEHIHVFRCKKCNRILQRNNEMNYCPKCGQPIKWQ